MIAQKDYTRKRRGTKRSVQAIKNLKHRSKVITLKKSRKRIPVSKRNNAIAKHKQNINIQNVKRRKIKQIG